MPQLTRMNNLELHMSNTWRDLQSIFIYGVIFALLFVLHIIFAAADLEILFRLVALTLSAMVFFCGLCLVYLEKSKVRYSSVYYIGMIVSCPLSIGLGWAYGGMSTSISMVLFPVITLIIHYTIKKIFFDRTYGLK
ncbi:MAG: hypothetical protein HON10_07300 [Euryarchaeota archaeon]|jgi:hypothetical protein|nr:hypothetical protein [Euryarchaeota archaeon]MBT7987393.1 hypothetical protein [Euryarchaeota archaeon]